MRIELDLFSLDRLMAFPLQKVPFIDFRVYLGWSILLFLLLVAIILYFKVRSGGQINEKLNRILSLAVQSGNVSIWRYNVAQKALYGIKGEMFFDEGESFDVFLTRIHPDDRDEYQKLFYSLLNSTIEQGEFVFRISVDGNYRYVKNSLVSVKEHGRIKAIIGTRIDVTEHIAQQQEVKEAADRFNTIFNVATVGVEFYDRNGILIEINQAAMNMLGVSDKESILAIGKSLYDDSVYRQFSLSETDKVKKFSIDIEYDLKQVEKDYAQESSKIGIRQFQVVTHPRVNRDGELDCTIVLIYDLTEDIVRNHQYERLYWESNSVLRALPVGVAIYQKDGTQKYINDAYVDIFCIPDRMEFLKQKSNLFENPALGQYRDRWFSLKENDSLEFETLFDFSTPELSSYYRADFKGRKHITVRARAIYSLEHDIDSFLVISSDASDAYNTLQELKLAKEKAEQSDLLKSVFLANMSHEIRTPLNAIVGFSDLAIGAEDKEEREEFGRIITANSQLLLNLINDILDLSKIEAGYLDFVEEECDIAELFSELALTFEMKMHPGVAFESINPYDRAVIFSDRKRITQVMNNFISNAIKYTPKGQITMGYEVLNDGIRLFVRDTGIGILDEKKPSVFKRFEKLDSFAQGTGLGLSICKALVEAKGGRVGFESTSGEGSLFWVWLPTPVEVSGDSTQSLGEDVELEAIVSDPIKENDKKITNILVVEDNDSNFILVRALLRDYQVDRAENGKIAVEKARSVAYDLIFMDMRMPVMGGLEATQLIREFDTKTPIVALTANVFDSDKADAIIAGCNGFVAKPIQWETIAKVLRGEYD